MRVEDPGNKRYVYCRQDIITLEIGTLIPIQEKQKKAERSGGSLHQV